MIKGILNGFLKTFDFSGILKADIQLKTPKDDVEALKSDFYIVSDDVWRASDEFKERYC